MTEIKEADDKQLTDIMILTQTVAELTGAVRTHNDILLCLLHKFELDKDLPTWATKEEVEGDVGAKIQACIEAIRRVYGPSETTES